MPALICGSLAYDTIMLFPERFRDHILPEQMHILNVSFLVPQLRREFGGVAGNIKVLLDHEGIRIRAVIRVIDRKERGETGSPRIHVKYRDSYIFESAAYALDHLLELDRVPPTVLRPYQGRPGSIQIWKICVVSSSWLNSACMMPVPADITCTSPASVRPSLPMLSRCSSAPSST